MKAGYSRIAFILDRSGSMGFLRDSAIEGFNTFVREQAALPGEADLQLVVFSDFATPGPVEPVANVQPLNPLKYIPEGSTALYDAIGSTIDATGQELANTPEEARPSKVIFAILTDGHENASNQYDKARVAEMIEHQQTVYGWEFVFLGANMDAQKEAVALNIPMSNSATFVASRAGLHDAYVTTNTLIRGMRAGV